MIKTVLDWAQNLSYETVTFGIVFIILGVMVLDLIFRRSPNE